MARELQELGMGEMAGVRNRGSKLTASDTNAVKGSKNWYFRAPEEVTGVEGFTLLSNAQTDQVRELIWFLWNEDDGSIVTELLAVAGTQLWSVDPFTGDYTLIGGAFSPDGVVSWAEVQDKLFIATGGVAPLHVYDPVAGTCEAILNERPVIPVLAVGAADKPPSGQYEVRYRAVFNDGNVGYASPEALIAVENTGITVTIPDPVDGTITGFDVYVRPPGPIGTASPEYFYRSGFLEGATGGVYEHETADAFLRLNSELEKYGDPPPLGIRFVAHAINRLWALGWDGEEATIRASDQNEPTSFTNLTQFRVNPGDSDIVTGIVAGVNRPGETARNLLATVFKRRGIYNLFDTGETLGAVSNVLLVQIERTRSRVGAVSENSIVQAPIQEQDSYLFLAPDGTIRAFTGEDSTDISEPVRDYLSDLNFAFAGRSYGYWLPRRKMVIWHYPRGNAEWPNFALGYHLETNNWVVFPDYPETAAGVTYRDQQNDELYYMTAAHADGGQYDLYRQFTGYTFNGAPITWQWRSKPLLTDTGGTYTFEYIEPICLEGEIDTFEIRAWRGFEDPEVALPWMDATVNLDRPGEEFVHPIVPLQNLEGDLIVDQEITLEFGETTIQPKSTMVGFRLGFRKKRRKRFDQPAPLGLKT